MHVAPQCMVSSRCVQAALALFSALLNSRMHLLTFMAQVVLERKRRPWVGVVVDVSFDACALCLVSTLCSSRSLPHNWLKINCKLEEDGS